MRTVLVLVAVILLATTALAQNNRCVLFDAHHIHTFSGFINSTTFLEHLGDYELAYWQGANLRVQVRHTVCDPAQATYRPCMTGFAISYSGTETVFFYDATTDTLSAMDSDSTYLRPLDYSDSALSGLGTISRRAPTGGYTITIDDASPIVLFVEFTPKTTMIRIDTNTLPDSGLCVDPTPDYPWVRAVPLKALDHSLFDNNVEATRPGMFPRNSKPPMAVTTASVAAINTCTSLLIGNGWLFDACVFDYDTFGNVDHIKGIQRDICVPECNQYTLTQVSNNPSNCITICDKQMDTLVDQSDTFLVHTTNYTGSRLPSVQVTFASDKASFFAPIGGEYTFGIKKVDCPANDKSCCGCQGPVSNVTVSVTCQQSFNVHAGRSVTVHYDDFLYPEVFLAGSIDGQQVGQSIHISWKFISGPNFGANGAGMPFISGQFSLYPSFIPLVSGVYVLEVVAFDGCLLKKDTVTVTAECYNAVLRRTSSMLFDPATIRPALVWTSTSPNTGTWGFPYLTLNSKEASLGAPKPQSVATIPAALSMVPESIAAPFSWVNPATQTNPVTWKRGVHLYQVISQSPTVTKTFNGSCGSIPDITDVPQLLYITPYERYEITTYDSSTCWQETSLTSTELVFDKYDQDECTYNYGTTGDLSATPNTAFSVINPLKSEFANNTIFNNALAPVYRRFEPFEFGSCTGWFDLTLKTKPHEAMCNSIVETLPIEVKCKDPWIHPVSKPLLPCFQVYYNYINGRWDPFTIDARDSSVGRSFKWTVLSTPIGSNNKNGSIANTVNPTIQLDKEGVYTVRLSTTDYCAVDHEIFTMEAVCQEILIPKVVVNGSTSFTWNHAKPFFGPLYIFNATDSRSTAPSFTVKWYIAQPNQNYSATPISTQKSFNFMLDSTTVLRGTWMVKAVLTDKCRTVEDFRTIVVTCPNQPVAAFNVNNTGPQYHLDNNGVPMWDPIKIVDTSNKAANLTRLFQIWNGNVSILNSTASPLVWTPSKPGSYRVVLIVKDNCNTPSFYEQTITASCAAVTIAPKIVALPSGPFYWETRNDQMNRYVYANYSTITPNVVPGYPFIYSWYTNGIPSGNGKYLLFDPTVTPVGVTSYALKVSNGCSEQWAYLNLTQTCRDPVTLAISTPQTIAWMADQNKFPIVTLSGAGSSVPNNVGTATWTVLKAPRGSIFKGKNDVWFDTVLVSNDTTKTTTTTNVPGYNYRFITRNITSTLVNQKIIRKAYSVITSQCGTAAPYGACFRPDLPGTYEIELYIQPGCPGTGFPRTTTTVTTTCPPAPSVTMAVTGETTVAPVTNQKITFDARGTTFTAPNTRFLWDLDNCAGVDLNDAVVNSASQVASFVSDRPGYFCLKLTVTDGCNVVSSTRKFYVNCSQHLGVAQIAPTTVSIVPQSSQEIVIPLVDAPAKSKMNNLYAWTYEWTLVSIKPAVFGARASAASTITGSFAMIFACLAFLIFHF